MNVADPLNILSLFSGSGMHDEAVCAALDVLGYRARVVGYCERDAFAAALLLARMESQTLEPAPVWCDCISKLDARPLRGHVDLIVASPPCQPYSSAGKRKGESDARSYGDAGGGPLPHTIRVIAECQPALVFFENVGEWVTGGAFQRFGEELSDLGYTLEDPLLLAAKDVGAPHERERVFILGHAAGGQRRFAEPGRGPDRGTAAWRTGEDVGDAQCERARAGAGQEPSPGERRDRSAIGGQDMGDAKRAGRRGTQRIQEAQQGRPGVDDGHRELACMFCGYPFDHEHPNCEGEGLADEELADGERAGRQRGRPAQAGELGTDAEPRCDGVPMFPPGRDDYRRWAELVAGGLDPTLMPTVESGVSVVADGLDAAADLLRAGGNGVVPLAAAVAFRLLWLRAFLQ